jgi:hypothetical protein
LKTVNVPAAENKFPDYGNDANAPVSYEAYNSKVIRVMDETAKAYNDK